MNISKIAELAGVSRATVSRYLNDGYVSDEKKQKIQKVIDKTGYVPSRYAQTLRTKRSNLIGVIVPKISSESVSRMVSGISKELAATGYSLLLGNTDLDLKKEIQYITIFNHNSVDGIILIGTQFTKEHKKALAKCRCPIVVLGQKLDGYCSVFHDDFESAYSATRLLAERGAKRIAYLGVHDADEAAGASRKEGYLKALHDCGLKSDPQWMRQGAFSMEFGYEASYDILDHSQVDAFFCATDNIAVGTMQTLKEKNIKAGTDILLASVGDSKMSRVVEPSLTSVHLHYHTAGREAAKLLTEQMESGVSVIKNIKLGCRIAERNSTFQAQNRL